MSESTTIRYERGDDGIVVLTLDDPNQSANTMNAAYVASMGTTVERLEAEKDEIKGVWHNYMGNFAKVGKDTNGDHVPDLDDPLWKTHSNTPGGQHDLAQRGLNKPYQTGKPGNGDWFYWSDEGAKCNTVA